MDYVGDIIRPPSEADSILLQATVGCSHNKCAFCGAYQRVRFAIKDRATVFADIEFAARHMGGNRRLFLCDGDALVMPQARLEELLLRIRERLPRVARVASYANAKAVAMKTDAELARLRELGVGLVYMGLESGHAPTLERMNKKGDPECILAQAARVRAAGMRLSVTVLLGAGGVEDSLAHARATGELLTRMRPEQTAALALTPIPGTPLARWIDEGAFTLPTPAGLLAELAELLEHIHLERGLFLADHASNYLPMRLRLPRDKAAALAHIARALDGRVALKPESLRGL
ncbi:MAG: radical SAM protein [Desulfovibrionaceae bacterium]|nr:radical SAM protein [Desulfovibrionaceae bacterium]